MDSNQSSTSLYPVLFRLGEVLDPQAKLYMILYGDRGESGKIYLTPSDGTKFEPGKQYRVSVNIKDIGKVQFKSPQSWLLSAISAHHTFSCTKFC